MCFSKEIWLLVLKLLKDFPSSDRTWKRQKVNCKDKHYIIKLKNEIFFYNRFQTKYPYFNSL